MAKTQVVHLLPPLHLLALEIKLPLERFDELASRRERQ